MAFFFFLVLYAVAQPSLSARLYEYGDHVDDLNLPAGDAEIATVDFSINFLRMPFETTYISTDGAISFDEAASPRSRLIAPFYADLDTSKKGKIWYRNQATDEDIARATEDIGKYFPSLQFQATHILVVTWDKVPIKRKRGLSKGITFQAVIITDHHYTFAQFLYADNNVFPKPKSIYPPIIGFSSTSDDFFDYTIASGKTKTVYETTRLSNVNEEGVWAFQIDGIEQYDITWGVPEGGFIQGDENLFNDVDTELNINLGAVGDDCSQCAASGSSCIEYDSGSCCVCNTNYFGNGKACLMNDTNRYYRANGIISGIINGIAIDDVNIHAYILPADGRTYTAISPTLQSLNYTLQFLLPIAETVGWLFAVPENKGINGIMATGGSCTVLGRLTFSSGEELTIHQQYVTRGEHIRITTVVDGTLPRVTDLSLMVDEHSQTLTRHRPGVIHSFEERTLVSSSGTPYSFSLDQTITFSDCLADEVDSDPILDSMSLTLSVINVYHEDGNPHLRFSMRGNIHPTDSVTNPCESNVCHMFAACLPAADSYRCECFEGFVGNGMECEEEIIDPCEENACHANAGCAPSGFTYTCTCIPGFEGDGFHCAEVRRDPCEINRCSEFAVCIADDDRYSCECRTGYVGDGYTCEEEIIDPCESNRCSVNADCIPNDLQTTYRCACHFGYKGNGVECEEVIQDPCEFNRCSRFADCIPGNETYYCQCMSGYSGDGLTCDEIIEDPCEFNRCSRFAVCIPGNGVYSCECTSGFSGDGLTCEEINPCESNRCSINADCIVDNQNLYRCECKSGFQGNGFACEAIRQGPCIVNRCHENAFCIPEGSTYYCQCEPGYEGDGFTCEEARNDPCANNTCDHNAVCLPQGVYNYYCNCVSGFVGDGYECEVVFMDPCLENDCNALARCIPNESVYDCECLEGYVGDGYVCNSADPCSDNECHPNGYCVAIGTTYDCSCNEGFLGTGFYCISEDPCYENDCDANATCTPDVDGNYICECNSGYGGDGYTCEEFDCSNCDANAECVPDGNLYRCVCNEGFTGAGELCEDEDECASGSEGICDPNAYCDNTFGSFVCTCRDGFVGDGNYCQVAARPSGDGVLFYGNGMSVMKLPLDTSMEGGRVVYKKRQIIVGLAYDCVDDVIYFTDVEKGSISRVKTNGSDYKRILTKGLSSPEGVAVDYLSRNLYWTDSGFDRIEVSSLDGRNRRVLFNSDIVNPRSIIVDPISGYLFWTDWNRKEPKIERSYADGNNREVLVKDGLRLPNGLTIDQVSQQICWADAGTYKLECIALNGDPLTRRTIFSHADYPFGLAAFDQNLYWTDWSAKSIFSVNKNGALSSDEMTLPRGGAGKLYGITTARECMPGSNGCADDNGGCSTLCLPSPMSQRTCACGMDSRGNEIPCN